jgi:hypothetical protein
MSSGNNRLNKPIKIHRRRKHHQPIAKVHKPMTIKKITKPVLPTIEVKSE